MREQTIKKYVSKSFGHLRVIKFDKQIGAHAFFVCKCKCGEVVSRRADGLLSGNPSCGCRTGLTLEARAKRRSDWQKKYFKKYNKNRRRHFEWQYRFLNAKSTARRRKKEWVLTFEEFFKIASGPCVYCKAGLSKNVSGTHIDRKNSRLGYTAENCVSACGSCNVQKGRILTYEDFMFIKQNKIN